MMSPMDHHRLASLSALVSAVHDELAPHYEQWALYDHFVDQNIAQTAAELAGTKRRPEPAE
jgi:hypothetical protein